MARKILLADDSVTAQNMGRRILTDAGYEVTTVNNGSAALKKVAESKPDLIVLDVYMPGYGGLEVCQRLRESDDTARIPVLLTVGKLEPFKVEDVRRVRADAFIIKPFEASELLTALTKLEDKIVPVAQSRKSGRPAKLGASVDEFMSTAREYGDTETGWKNRLRIPPPHRKSQPEFPEPEPDRPRGVHPRQQQEPEHAKPEPEREATAKDAGTEERQAKATPKTNLPADITAEEIAAIQAAAAAFAPPPESVEKPKPDVETRHETVAEIAAEPPVSEPATAAAAPSDSENHAEPAASLPSEVVPEQPPTEPAAPEIAAASQADQTTQSPAPTEAVAAAESTAAAASDNSTADQEKLAEHEVAAVLASLEFVNGTAVDEADEPLFATIAAAPVREEPTGPRWVAAAVPLTEEESSLVLEQEMQKALAAMAELSAATPISPETVNAVASENVEPPVQMAGDVSETKSEEATPAMAAISAEPPPASPEPVEAVATAMPEPAAAQELAAYAAAASAGSTFGEATVSVEAVAPTPTREPASSADAAEPQPDSELASAWASWKQIRESVVSPQITSQIADAAASATSSSVESTSTETSQAESAAAEAEVTGNGEDTAIASIVDNVLAELKPKLMQEIAKKMGKPKKRR